MGKPKVATKMRITERRARVAELLKMRYTVTAIAEILKVSRPLIYKDCAFMEAQWIRDGVMNFERQRLIDIASLNDVERAMKAKAMKGNTQAAQAYAKLNERRSKLIGYETAVKLAMETKVEIVPMEESAARKVLKDVMSMLSSEQLAEVEQMMQSNSNDTN